MSTGGQVSENSPSWCHAPFDPEGILRCPTFLSGVSCYSGLVYSVIMFCLSIYLNVGLLL